MDRLKLGLTLLIAGISLDVLFPPLLFADTALAILGLVLVLSALKRRKPR